MGPTVTVTTSTTPQQHAGGGNSTKSRRTRRLRAFTKPTAWKDWQEFQSVGESLLHRQLRSEDVTIMDDSTSGEMMMMRTMPLPEALERVSVWRCRHPQLPHAIESTAALAELLWNDSEDNDSDESFGFLAATSLRSAYASVLVRCLNGLVDTMQQSRAMATSVALLAQSLGVPAWLVDLRHASTHNALPQLKVLRLAARTWLDYWQAVYWVPLFERRKHDETQAEQLMQAYRTMAEPPALSMASPSGQACETSTTGQEEDEVSSQSDNPFAVLQDPPKKKKKKTPAAKSSPRKRRKASSWKGPSASQLQRCAQAFVQSNLSPDILWNTALHALANPTDGLCWWPLLSLSTLSSSSVLGTAGSQKMNVNQHRGMAHKLYGPLIDELIRAWPQFAKSLFKELIESSSTLTATTKTKTMKSEQSPNSPPNNTGHVSSFWIDYLQSEKFRQTLDPAIRDEISQCIQNQFVSNSQQDTANTDDKQVQGNEPQQHPPKPIKRSLSDLEAMLEHPEPTSTQQSPEDELRDDPSARLVQQPVNDGSRLSAWVRCESWNPCAIGMLPGERRVTAHHRTHR